MLADEEEQGRKLREAQASTLVTRAPVAVPNGWRRVELTKAELAELETRSWKYLLASKPPETLQRELPVEMRFEAFDVAGRRIEFASVAYETDKEGSAYGMSIAWGLIARGQAFEFHGPQPTGFVHFYRLLQAADIGADGTTELILYYTTNSSSVWEIWQQKSGTFEIIGIVNGP